jgi:hypothetical protein
VPRLEGLSGSQPHAPNQLAPLEGQPPSGREATPRAVRQRSAARAASLDAISAMPISSTSVPGSAYGISLADGLADHFRVAQLGADEAVRKDAPAGSPYGYKIDAVKDKRRGPWSLGPFGQRRYRRREAMNRRPSDSVLAFRDALRGEGSSRCVGATLGVLLPTHSGASPQ